MESRGITGRDGAVVCLVGRLRPRRSCVARDSTADGRHRDRRSPCQQSDSSSGRRARPRPGDVEADLLRGVHRSRTGRPLVASRSREHDGACESQVRLLPERHLGGPVSDCEGRPAASTSAAPGHRRMAELVGRLAIDSGRGAGGTRFNDFRARACRTNAAVVSCGDRLPR
jgi:hypothetical protein